MDRPLVVVAQASVPQGSNGNPSKVITVNKPQGEQAITIHLDGSTKLDLSAIANEQITLVHVGDRLIILFDNHAQVTVEPFYNDNGQPLADLTVELGPGRDVTASQFAEQFPITDDPSVLPASGGPNAPSSGANFVSFTLDTLSTPSPLDLLKPETFGSQFGAPDEAPGNTQIVPMSLTNAVINGGVDEGGMATDTIHTVGNDPGAAFSATGVTGSLNALVNFGTGGPNGHPFQFVSAAAANSWLAHLGLESHGALIDTATVSGNTLTASTDPAQGTPHDVFTLTINDDGSWVFTLLAPLDHPAGQGENTALLDLSGLIQAVDAAGIHLTLSNDFKITVVDDVPVEITGAVASGSVEEAALDGISPPGDLFGIGNDPGHHNGFAVTFGSLSGLVSFGADGPASATVSFEGEGSFVVAEGFQFAVATGAHDFGLTSHGEAVDYLTVTQNGTFETLTAWTDGGAGHEVFQLELEGDGGYVFTLINPLDQMGDDTTGLTLDLSSLVKAVDFDGDSIALSGDFTITVANDVPVLVGEATATGSVDEGALFRAGTGSPGDLYGDGNDHGASGAVVTLTGSLSGLVSFGADGPAETPAGVDRGFRFAIGDNTPDSTLIPDLTSHGDRINFFTVATAADGSSQTLTAWTTGGPADGGHEVFTLLLNGDGTYTFTLINPLDDPTGNGENSVTLDLSTLIKATDFDGDSVALSGDFQITIVDDVPVQVSGTSSGFVDEGGLDQVQHFFNFHTGTDLYGDGNDPFAPTVASGTIAGLVHFGADGAESGTFSATFTDSHHHTHSLTQTIADGFHFVDVNSAEAWLSGQGITSHGQDIDVVTVTSTTSTNGTTVSDIETLAAWTDGGPDHGGHEVFTLSLNVTTGAWTFTLLNPIDHPTDNGENATLIDVSGLMQGIDFDGDALVLSSGTVTITVKDDVPVLDFFDNSYGKVDEGALHIAYSGSPGDLYGDGNDQGRCDFATATTCGSLEDLVRFGADGPAAKEFQFVSPAAAQAWITSLGLKSHGDLIDTASISTDAHGNLVLTAGTDQGDGHSVFTLTLDQSSGQWLFTLLNPLDQSTDNGENTRTIDLSGLVQAVDFDGDTVTLANDFSITVVDDVPELTCVNSSGTVDEGALVSSSFLGDLYGSGNDTAVSGSSVTVTGSLSGLVAFGADGPNATADFRFVSQSAAAHWLDRLNLTSHGSDVDNVSIVNQGGGFFLLTASADDGHKVFTLQLDEATGAWTFTLLNPIDHAPDHGENSTTLDLSGLIQGVDFDGDAITLSDDFTIKIVDDVPVLTSGHSTGSVDEGGLSGSAHADVFGSGNDHGAVTATGTLSSLVSFGADGQDTGTAVVNHHTVTINTGFQFVSDHTAESWLASLNGGHGFKSHGETIDDVQISVSNGIATLTAGTDHHNVFTLQLNESTGAWTFTLINPLDDTGQNGDAITLDLSGLVRGVDFDGDAITLSGDFSVMVTDDAPVLIGNRSSTGSVDEGGLHSSSTLGDLYGSGNDHGAITATGSLAQLVSFGADGPATGGGFRLVDSATATAWLSKLGLMSHNTVDANGGVNQYVDVAIISGNTLQAWAGHPGDPGAHEVFTLTLNSDGTYTFTLINPLDDPTPGHGNPAQAVADAISIDLSGFVQAVDFDGDVLSLASGSTPNASSDFHITVVDDIPVLVSGAVVSASMDEGALRSIALSGTDTWGTGNDSGPVTASGAAGSLNSLVHFGADGPAGTDFKIATHDDALSWLQKLDLTSHGSAVDQIKITVDGVGGSTLTVSTEDGHDVFTLTVHPDGSWAFTLLEPIDHTGATWSGSGPEPTTTLDLSGFVRAVDFDGDAISFASGTSPSSSSDFRVTITDDVPTPAPHAFTAFTVDEGALSFAAQGSGPKGDFFGNGNDQGGSATAGFSGSISGLVNFGADGAAAGGGFRLVDATTATAWLKALNLTSHNVAIDLAVIQGNTLQAWTGDGPGPGHPGAHEVFTLTLNGDGSFSFQLINPIDDPVPGHGTPGPATEDSVSLDLSGLVQAVDFDGDVRSLSIGVPSPASNFIVTVVDDVPVQNASAIAVTGSIDEGALTPATDSYGTGNDPLLSASASGAAGSLAGLVKFGADGPAATAFHVVDAATAGVWLAGLGLTSHGLAVDHATVSGATLTALDSHGEKVFTLTVNGDGSWTFNLLEPIDHPTGAGENPVSVDLSGLVEAIDFDGDAITLHDVAGTVPTPVGLPPGHYDTLTVNGATFDGLLFSGTAVTSFTNPGDHTDAVNVSGNGLGIGNAQITDHEGFMISHPGADAVSFELFKVGNGTTSVTVSWAAYDGATPTSSSTPVATGTMTVVVDANGDPVVIDPPGTFDHLVLRFDVPGNDKVVANDFSYTASGSAGVFSVSITDDVPVLNGSAAPLIATVDEGGLTSATDSYGVGNDPTFATSASGVSGSLQPLVKFGADGPAASAFQLVDSDTAGEWLTSLGLTSHGFAINAASINGSTLTALDAHGDAVFMLTINGDGSWNFQLLEPLDHGASATPENSATIDLSGLVQAVDFDGDVVTLSGDLNITVVDDIPVAHHVSATISETAGSAIITLAAGHDFGFGADGPGTVTFDTQHAVVTGPNGVPLGTVSYVVNGDSLEIDFGTAFQHLGAGQSATIDIAYTVTDAEGDKVTSDILVEVDGINHPPAITSAAETVAVTEGESYIPAANLITNGGFESWSYNSQTNSYSIPGWTFANFLYPPGVSGVAHLGSVAGDFATYPSTNLGTLSQTVTDEAGQVYKIDFWALPGNGSGVVSTANTISVSWDGMTVLAQSNVPSITTTNPTNANQYVEYTAQVVGTGSDLFAITLGTDYYWFIDDVSVKAVLTPGVENRQGTLTFTDADTSDTHTVSVTPDGSGYHGTFNAVIGADSTGGHTGTVIWTYTVNDSDLTFLASGQTTTQTYTVIISDGHTGGTTSQDVAVTLTGGGAAALAFALDPASDSHSAINETSSNHLSSGDVIGTFSAVGDPNPDTFTYSFAGGTHTDLSLNASTGVLSVNSSMTGLTDTFTISASDGHDPAVTTTMTVWVGSQNGDTQSFAANTSNILVAYGLGGNDTLTGESGTNTTSILVGSGGTDTLIAGGGNNVMVGGSGNDTFVFNAAPSSGHGNTITDFSTGHDQLNVSAAGLGGIFSGENPATIFESSASNSFTSSADRFHYDTANHGLYFSADGTTAHEVLLATVTNGSVAASDIHVVA